MPNKLMILIVSILVAGGAVYALVRPTAPAAPVDIWAGYLTEVTPTIPEEKKMSHEQQIIELTEQINDKQAVGEYVLDLLFLRGGYYQKIGQLKLAFDDYQTVVDGDPANETAWNNMGDVRLDVGDINGAEAYYLKAIENYPGEVQYNKLYRYYSVYREDDRFEAIGPLLLQAVSDVSDSTSLWVKLGRWYVAKGDKDKAVSAFGQAAILDPENQAIKDELNEAMRM